MIDNSKVKNWYQASYLDNGINAQRLYPNEELLRFMGRNFFSLSENERKRKVFLEIGCGSCSNLWMIAKEGFSTYGIDISKEAVNLGHQMLSNWGVSGASLDVGSMTELPYEDNQFDAVIDIFSSYCMNMESFHQCLKEVYRVLKTGGYFFSYTPGKGSGAFLNSYPSKMIDSSTLDGVHRKNSPFYGNDYPFRFIESIEYANLLRLYNFRVDYLETITRTYNQLDEGFEHVVIEGIKL